MSSPGLNVHLASFIGVAADVTVALPFTPRMVRMMTTTGVYGVKTDQMAGDAYYVVGAADTGVTIGDKQITIANGADVNVATETTYIEAME